MLSIRSFVVLLIVILGTILISYDALANSVGNYIALSALERLRFEVRIIWVGDMAYIVFSRDNQTVETGIDRHVAFINYKEMMVLQEPPFYLNGEIFIPVQLLNGFKLSSSELNLARAITLNAFFSRNDLDKSQHEQPTATLILPGEHDQLRESDFDLVSEGSMEGDIIEEQKENTDISDRHRLSDDIEAIEFYIDKNDQLLLTIKLKKVAELYRIFSLSNPERLVIDLFNLDVIGNSIPLDIVHIERLRIAPTTEGYARFVFDLKEPAGYITNVRDNEILIYFLQGVPEFVVVLNGNNNESHMSLRTSEGKDLNFFLLSQPPRIVFDLIGYRWAKQTEYLDVHHNLFHQVRISDYSVSPAITRIVFEGRHSFTINEFNSGNAKILTFLHGDMSLRGRKIVVDAGHGGSDPGAVRQGVREKDITLAVALELATLLRRSGAEVVLTRSDDKFVTLYDRVRIANNTSADLFISVHTNAHNQGVAEGFEVYYWHDHSKRAATVFEKVIREDLNRVSRGVKRNRFYVIRETRMPAILIELGFISNSKDLSLMTDPNFARKQAETLLKAVMEYFGAS